MIERRETNFNSDDIETIKTVVDSSIGFLWRHLESAMTCFDESLTLIRVLRERNWNLIP